MENKQNFVIEKGWGLLVKYKGRSKDVTIPDGVREIGWRAFFGCKKLTCVRLPASIKKIDKSAFADCCPILIAPHMLLTSFDKAHKTGAIRGFARAYLAHMEMDEKTKAANLKYIKGQRKRLYATALEDAGLLRLMVQEVMIPQEDFQNLFDQAVQKGDAEVNAMLLEYQHKHLKPVDIEKKFEKEMKAADKEAEAMETGIFPVTLAKKLWKYDKREDGTLVLLQYKGDESNIVIPVQIGKDRVSTLGNNEFRGTIRGIKMDTLTIPEGITTIETSAVSAVGPAKTLTTIRIPASLKTIKPGAFENCPSIRNWVIDPKNEIFTVTEDGMLINQREKTLVYAFNGLTSAAIPEGVTKIGDGAFDGCTGLTGVTIPEGVTEIGHGAFNNCESLTGIKIPKSVTKIGANAFCGCKNLTAIPEGMTEIGRGTFQNCLSLTSVIIPEGSTEIGDWAFQGCKNLTSVTIPESVTRIGKDAFIWCWGLTSIIIPEGVTEIGEEAFQYCENLTSVTIPESVIKIGYEAFSDCKKLTGVTILGRDTQIARSAFRNSRRRILRAPAGSYAEQYAQSNNIKFEAL